MLDYGKVSWKRYRPESPVYKPVNNEDHLDNGDNYRHLGYGYLGETTIALCGYKGKGKPLNSSAITQCPTCVMKHGGKW